VAEWEAENTDKSAKKGTIYEVDYQDMMGGEEDEEESEKEHTLED
jgi:hypothetical protein